MAWADSSGARGSVLPRLDQLIARPGFQARALRWPIINRFARRDGAEIFHLIQGFVSSQVLLALIEIEVLDHLAQGPATVEALAQTTRTQPDRLRVFLQAGAAMGLLKRKRGDRYGLARKGAALRGVPGLTDMILHHKALYQDLAAPKELLQGKTDTELAAFWPYVFAAPGIEDGAAERYSDLMARSQRIVADDTLRRVSFAQADHIMDVGGGSGAFLAAVARAYPSVRLSLFDLPETQAAAQRFLASEGVADRITRIPGSFRDGALPDGADVITLIRVLYDHSDDTVRDLLAKVHAALPPGGRLVVSEPMSGGAKPDPITDVYFAIYTLAMGTGRTRSAAEIATLLREAGFTGVTTQTPIRSYVTRTLTAEKPSA